MFLGDDAQLPPVLDSPVYTCKGKTPAAIHGALVWQEFTQAVTLNTIIRQSSEEQQLRDTLLSLRQYKTTPEQVKWLQGFQWNNLEREYGQELMKRMNDQGMFVFPTHQEEGNHNRTKLLKLNEFFPIAKLNAVCKGVHAKNVPSDKAGGLLQTLFLCKEAKVMLSVNICVKFGLFNGANGKVVDIIYLGEKSNNSLPDVIMVEFLNYTGPPFIAENPKIIPIIPIERRLDCSCHFCKRKQIPLRLRWATTIHRCQGLTIGAGETNRYIIITPGTRSFESRNPGALFVALSRAKSAGNNISDPDFAWHQSVMINEDRLCHVVNTFTTNARSREIARISGLSKSTQVKLQYLRSDKKLRSFVLQLLDTSGDCEE